MEQTNTIDVSPCLAVFRSGCSTGATGRPMIAPKNILWAAREWMKANDYRNGAVDQSEHCGVLMDLPHERRC